MDFRKDLSRPFQTPFQATVARYTENYVLLISGSKAFSYAGQRIGFLAVSEKLSSRTYPGLARRYGNGTFGHALVARMLYGLSAGTSHSAQFAMTALMKAASDGTFHFLNDVAVYGRRAHIAKKCFTDNGFSIVYDNDLGEEIADGFYFTVAYPGFKGSDLMRELLFYGICTSFVKEEQLDEMRRNLEIFKENHSSDCRETL
jgi:aspartate/methionine/tyrosine aminotransferase